MRDAAAEAEHEGHGDESGSETIVTERAVGLDDVMARHPFAARGDDLAATVALFNPIGGQPVHLRLGFRILGPRLGGIDIEQPLLLARNHGALMRFAGHHALHAGLGVLGEIDGIIFLAALTAEAEREENFGFIVG